MKFIPLTVLTVLVVLGLQVRAADAPVDPAKLSAFMEKWKDYRQFQFPQDEADQPLLLAALAKDPTGIWSAYFALQAGESSYQLRSLTGKEREAAAAKAADSLKPADQILAAAIAKGGTNAASLSAARASVQQMLLPLLIEGGPKYLAEVRTQAEDMFARLPATNDWNYGNVVYDGNQMLGRVALREGKLDAARQYLRKAGQAPSSPQLGSFGPDNQLARELLQHGEPADREAVLAYLTDTAHFWARPLPNDANAQRVAEDHLKQLETWKEQIRAGKVPNDPRWR
jgi:hypothetical protein